MTRETFFRFSPFAILGTVLSYVLPRGDEVIYNADHYRQPNGAFGQTRRLHYFCVRNFEPTWILEIRTSPQQVTKWLITQTIIGHPKVPLVGLDVYYKSYYPLSLCNRTIIYFLLEKSAWLDPTIMASLLFYEIISYVPKKWKDRSISARSQILEVHLR